jgi:hypothetical protein
MLRRVALVRTDVSEEPGASFIRVTRIIELRTTQAATSNRLRCEEIPSEGVFWDVTPCGSCKDRRFRNVASYKSHTAERP